MAIFDGSEHEGNSNPSAPATGAPFFMSTLAGSISSRLGRIRGEGPKRGRRRAQEDRRVPRSRRRGSNEGGLRTKVRRISCQARRSGQTDCGRGSQGGRISPAPEGPRRLPKNGFGLVPRSGSGVGGAPARTTAPVRSMQSPLVQAPRSLALRGHVARLLIVV